jgi:molybdopterin/thiamine biosynthesis adenylyltransferase
MTTINDIQYTRQELILDPITAHNTKVYIFGCGTVGSNVAVELAKMGIGNLYVYDFDVVEPHNIPSQRFDRSDIGVPKVHALMRQLGRVTNSDATLVGTDSRVEGPMLADGIVVIAVDSMQSRRNIWEKIARYSTGGLVLDFRMSGNLLQVYAFKPSDTRYEHSLFSDDAADPTPCGGRTVSYTGALSGSVGANYVRKFLNDNGSVPYFTAIDLESMSLVKSGDE